MEVILLVRMSMSSARMTAPRTHQAHPALRCRLKSIRQVEEDDMDRSPAKSDADLLEELLSATSPD